MTTRLGLGRRADDGYVLRQTASIGLGPVRLLRGAPPPRWGGAGFLRGPGPGGWGEGGGAPRGGGWRGRWPPPAGRGGGGRGGAPGGPPPRGGGPRLFVPLAGPWSLGRGCAGRRRCGEPGGWCEGAHSWSRPTARASALRAAGDMSSRAGTFDAVGDGNPVPVRAGCPRLERTAPGRAECPRLWWRHGRLRMQWRRAICASPAGPQRGTASSPA